MDLITGLPIHPLINHGVAVLVPLAAIGALLVIFIPLLLLLGNYAHSDVFPHRNLGS